MVSLAAVIMLLRIIAIICLVPLAAVLSGCACPSGGCVPGTPCVPCSFEPAEIDLPPPDLANLDCKECELLPLPEPTETYQLLDASTCQCSAATNSAVANMVELERLWAKIVIECDTKAVQENYCLDRDLLALHATGLRNNAAASALESFYQLAGLEAQKHYLQQGIDETQRTLSRIDKLRKEGIDLPDGVSRGPVAARLHELQDTSAQLDFMRIQLNGQLQKLLGCPLNETSFYWPKIEWQADFTPVDVDAELAEGLDTRSDLRGLSLVLCKMDKTTLPVARAVLAYADGTIGTVDPRKGLIHVARCFRCNQHEIPVRCRQLSLFYTDTELLATAEIKSAVFRIVLQQQRTALAQQAVEQRRSQLDELEKTRDIKNVTIFEISQARGELYQAESDLIEQVISLELAKVNLRKAKGILAKECGFDPVLCCEGCCDGACCQCQHKSSCQCKCKTSCNQNCSCSDR